MRFASGGTYILGINFDPLISQQRDLQLKICEAN